MPKQVVTAATLAGIDKSFQVKFNGAYLNVPAFFKKLCMICPSSAAENVYAWLASLPQISKKTGDIIRARLQVLGYSLVNEEFAGIIEVPRTAIEDDTYGMFAPVAATWGQRAGQAPDLELIQLLVRSFSGTKGKDYTNSAFFGTNKKAFDKATPFTNVGAKKFSAANFVTGMASLRERKDAAGVPLFTMQDPSQVYLVVCADDEAEAEAAVKLDTLSGGGKNPNYNKAQLIVLPGLQSAAQADAGLNDANCRPWFILDCSQPVKPLIYQPRLDFEITPNFNMTSDMVFNDEVFAWKARGRFTLGYGLPEFAYGSTGKSAA